MYSLSFATGSFSVKEKAALAIRLVIIIESPAKVVFFLIINHH